MVSLTGSMMAACSENSAPDKTSTFQGSLALDTFPHAPDGVVATNEAGVTAQVPVASAGDFRVELPREHRYTLAVASGTERVMVVFPRTSGLTSTFAVSSGAAVVSLGNIRYLSSAPGTGFFLESAHVMVAADAAEVADGEPGECVNGALVGSGAICVDDAGDVACEGDASDGDGECENGIDTMTGLPCIDPPDGSDGDGECANGVDATTGLPCTDVDGAIDPQQPMAVAEHNVPDHVGGCDDGDGEEQDD